MAFQPQQRTYTLEEYLELEKASEERLEFWNGHVWSMSGARLAHNQIVTNLTIELGNRLRPTGCQVLGPEMRIKVPDYPPYRYPDLIAFCGKPQIELLGGQEMIMNPQLIVEVLSDSTEAFDRGHKFTYYKSIPSFTEYLLISQKKPHVTQFVKHEQGFWANYDHTDLDDGFVLQSVGCELALSAIYYGIGFDT